MEHASNPPAALKQGCQLSVLVPARNEAQCIAACLRSLVAQSEDTFLLGRDWELIVIDDGSTDATRSLALEFSGVQVLTAPPVPEGWTGKTNALWFGAQQARGLWLLCTDADTEHEPGNLRRALHEAQKYQVGLLSYSPRQLVQGLGQRALMPLVFAELAQKYPPRLVNLPESPVAAANGQFLLFNQAVYRRIGGHKAVHGVIAEDMALARLVKQAHAGLRLRHAPDALRARMYRGFRPMIEGWRKNLIQLFPDALSRGLLKLFQALLLFGLPLAAVWMYLTVARTPAIWAVVLWWAWRVRIFFTQAARSHFPVADLLLAPLALPLFAWLLLDSWLGKTMRRSVAWKGRSYPA